MPGRRKAMPAERRHRSIGNNGEQSHRGGESEQRSHRQSHQRLGFGRELEPDQQRMPVPGPMVLPNGQRQRRNQGRKQEIGTEARDQGRRGDGKAGEPQPADRARDPARRKQRQGPHAQRQRQAQYQRLGVRGIGMTGDQCGQRLQGQSPTRPHRSETAAACRRPPQVGRFAATPASPITANAKSASGSAQDARQPRQPQAHHVQINGIAAFECGKIPVPAAPCVKPSTASPPLCKLRGSRLAMVSRRCGNAPLRRRRRNCSRSIPPSETVSNPCHWAGSCRFRHRANWSQGAAYSWHKDRSGRVTRAGLKQKTLAVEPRASTLITTPAAIAPVRIVHKGFGAQKARLLAVGEERDHRVARLRRSRFSTRGSSPAKWRRRNRHRPRRARRHRIEMRHQDHGLAGSRSDLGDDVGDVGAFDRRPARLAKTLAGSAVSVSRHAHRRQLREAAS